MLYAFKQGYYGIYSNMDNMLCIHTWLCVCECRRQYAMCIQIRILWYMLIHRQYAMHMCEYTRKCREVGKNRYIQMNTQTQT